MEHVKQEDDYPSVVSSASSRVVKDGSELQSANRYPSFHPPCTFNSGATPKPYNHTTARGRPCFTSRSKSQPPTQGRVLFAPPHRPARARRRPQEACRCRGERGGCCPCEGAFPFHHIPHHALRHRLNIQTQAVADSAEKLAAEKHDEAAMDMKDAAEVIKEMQAMQK